MEKLKVKIIVPDDEYKELKAEGSDLKQVVRQMILRIYENERLYARNKSDAVMNTAVILGVSEPTVWRVITDERK